METPEWHVRQGNTLLARPNIGDREVVRAESEFDKALELDPEHAPAHVGLAIVGLHRGDLEQAERHAKEARGLDDKHAGSYIAMGRIEVARGEKDWLQNAGKEFRKAQELDPDSPEVWFYHGQALARGYRYSEAKERFARVLELKKGLEEPADAAWEKMQLIERASPGTINGKRIALVDRLTRAEMGILFVDELGLLDLLEKKRPKVYDTTFKTPQQASMSQRRQEEVSRFVPDDIHGHWGETALEQIVRLNLRACSPMPDGMFNPDAEVSRAEFALMVEDVLVLLTGDASLSRKYIGEPESHFPDLRTDHAAYNAINLTVDRGILSADKNGRFGVKDSISGAEALLAIRNLSALI